MKIYSSELLHIKEIEISELTESVMVWFNDRDLMKYYTSSKKAITKNILIESIIAGKESKNNYTLGIYYTDSDILIGTIKIGPINQTHKISDLVVLIGNRNYHGKGLAQQAIRLGNKVAFDYFNLRKLFGGMYMENVASIKAYTRSDWLVESVLKGHYFTDGNHQDRVLVGCFNPKYFSEKYLQEIKMRSDEFLAQNNFI